LLFLLAHVVALLAAAALERAWPQPLRFGDAAPNLVLVLVACAGITHGRVTGYATGLVGGLFVGAAGDRSFAGALISLMAVGLLAGHIRGRVFADHVMAAPVLAVLATVVSSLLYFVISPPPSFIPWVKEVGRLMLYNAVVSPPLYLYARALARRWPPRTEL